MGKLSLLNVASYDLRLIYAACVARMLRCAAALFIDSVAKIMMSYL